jgi:hypothetical protein
MTKEKGESIEHDFLDSKYDAADMEGKKNCNDFCKGKKGEGFSGYDEAGTNNNKCCCYEGV